MRYPVEQPTSVPGSGNAFYMHLLENVHVPAALSHELWYRGCEDFLKRDDHPFCGFFPIGKTLKISYGGSEMADYTFTGNERNPVYVKDLSTEALLELGISSKARPDDKVFNPFFRLYRELPADKKKSNELPTLSLAKSICSFLSAQDMLFTEKDIVDMLTIAVKSANSPQMRHILHGNHVAWCAARFIETGTMEEDVKKNFYGQNPIEFYVKDIGTIMPAFLYSFAIMGINPMEVVKWLDYDIWGIDAAAEDMQKYMKANTKARKAA